ncbi:hypothetical protein FFF34_012190 [Inquilinus sp. KBS0705]|nr:hypothetical protein FFF34_012190 [Inquilinus sp. KBS0705]
MRTILIILLLSAVYCISQLGCKFENKSKKERGIKEFEGIITYHEIFKNSDSSFNVDDTVQVFYSKGNYVGVHSDKSQQIHVVKDYYFESKPLRLLLFNNSDTLYQLNLNFPIEKLDYFKVKKVSNRILSRKCESIDLNTSYSENDATTYTDFNFIFSRGYLSVNKDHFKNWHLGFFDKVVNESGAFYLKLKAVHFDSSHKNVLSSKTYDVISVKEEAVDPKIFEIDATLIDDYPN